MNHNERSRAPDHVQATRDLEFRGVCVILNHDPSPSQRSAAGTFAMKQAHGTLYICHQRDTGTQWKTLEQYLMIPFEEHVRSRTVARADLVSGARTRT